MTIDSEKHIVEVHVNAGVYSSDSIFDYSRVSKSRICLDLISVFSPEVVLKHCFFEDSCDLFSS